MLIQVNVQNFKSFNESNSLNMIASNKLRKQKERLYEKLNKVQNLQCMFEAAQGFDFYRKYGKMVRIAVSGLLIPTDDRKRK